VDWVVLAAEWGTDLKEVVVWYCDFDMAEGVYITEEEMDLGRTEELDIAPLECSSATEVQRWITEARIA
jgi:hypothetical protein